MAKKKAVISLLPPLPPLLLGLRPDDGLDSPVWLPQRFQKRWKESDSQTPEPWWTSSKVWRQEAVFWKEQGQDDLQRHCIFLADQWALAEGCLDRRAYKLLGDVTTRVYQECVERKVALRDGRMHRSRSVIALRVLGFLYRQWFTPPKPPLGVNPEDMSDFLKAWTSAARATLALAGKDCENWWEN